MNKYLKGFLNSIIQLAIGFVGGLFSFNILAVGFIFFPDIVMRTDQALMGYLAISNVGVFEGVLNGVVRFAFSCLPLCFILVMLSVCVSSLFFTIWLVQKVDIEEIVAGIVGSDKAKPKEVKP